MIADGHSDLLQELVHAQVDGEANPLRTRWLSQLLEGGVGLQVCAVYRDPADGDGGLRDVLRQVSSFRSAVESNPEVVAVKSRYDLEELGSERVGLVLAIEGLSALGDDHWLLDVLAALGVRVVGLTWNERNSYAHGCDHDGGLTRLGEELVDRLPDVGMVIDLAHASPQTFADVLERARSGAVFVSHAACRATYDHRRNLDDAQLTALADHGGVICLMPHPLVVDPHTPTLERFVDHIDHAVALVGANQVALGGDFLEQIARTLGAGHLVQDGVRMDATIEGLAGPAEYPRLLDALRDRGYARADVEAIAGGNLLRFLAGALPA